MGKHLLDCSRGVRHRGSACRLGTIIGSLWNFFGFLALISKDIGFKLLNRGSIWAFAHLIGYSTTNGRSNRSYLRRRMPLRGAADVSHSATTWWAEYVNISRCDIFSYLLIQSINLSIFWFVRGIVHSSLTKWLWVKHKQMELFLN